MAHLTPASRVAARWLLARQDRAKVETARSIYDKMIRYLKTKPSLARMTYPGNDVQIRLPGNYISNSLDDLTIWFGPMRTKTFYNDQKEILAIGASRVIRDTDSEGEPWEIALGLAERAKSSIIHELTHYLDKHSWGEGWAGAESSYPAGVDARNPPPEYFNHPIETNAYFVQGLAAATEKVEKAIKDITPDRPNENDHFMGAWVLQEWLESTTFPKFRREFWAALPNPVEKRLTRENRKRFESRLYQAWDELRDRGIEVWRELEKKDPKTAEFFGDLRLAGR